MLLGNTKRLQKKMLHCSTWLEVVFVDSMLAQEYQYHCISLWFAMNCAFC